MASALRPTLLRQAFAAAPAKRTFSSAVSAAPRFRQQLLRPAVQQSIIRQALPCTAFSTSQKRDILPPLPQKISGTVNDAARVPDAAPSHGSYHWTFERLISIGLVPLTLAPFAAGSLNPALDAVLVASLLIHSHIGFQSVIIDYIPNHRMPGIRKLFMWGLNLALVLVGWGYYEFETNDVGLTEAIKRIWHA